MIRDKNKILLMDTTPQKKTQTALNQQFSFPKINYEFDLLI